LFIEDIDTWLKDYTVDLLKTEMDGLRQNRGILTILTSNNPEKLPDALLDRPGRFHHVLNFSVPAENQRMEMLRQWIGDLDEKTMAEIVARTGGYSGAHMKELVDFARIIADEDGLPLGEAIIKSLKRMEDQRELVGNIRRGNKAIDPDNLEAIDGPTSSMPYMLADVLEHVNGIEATIAEIKGVVEGLKVSVVAPVSANVETAPKVEAPIPAPAPAPQSAPTPAELRAAAIEALRGMDIAAVIKSEITLALSKLRGKVESK
jgi:hypothetical protein